MHKVARLLIPVAFMGLVAGCGSSGHSASSSTTNAGGPLSTAPATTASATTAPPSTSGSSTSQPAPTTTLTPECASANLTASLGQSDGTAGTIYYPLVFTNKGSSICTIQGYPGVSFVTGTAGQQLGAPARRETGPAPLVALAPGQSTSATLGIVEAGNFGSSCQITNVVGLRVYPPNNTAALYVPHSDQGCANTADVTLNIRPVGAAA